MMISVIPDVAIGNTVEKRRRRACDVAGRPEGLHYGFSGRAHANKAPPPPTRTYWRPSSSYVIGPLPTRPMAACQSVAPSLVRRPSTLPAESPVNVNPESVVSTPAPDAPSPRSWLHRILPV